MQKSRYSGPERRAAPRVELLSHVFYSAGRMEGRGMLNDLSLTGARVENASPRLQPGTDVRLTFALDEDKEPIRISGTVVRQTEGGFGVQFTEVDDQVRHWIEAALAQTGGPGNAVSTRRPATDPVPDALEGLRKFLARSYDERDVERMKALKPDWNVEQDVKGQIARLATKAGWSDGVRAQAEQIAAQFVKDRFGSDA